MKAIGAACRMRVLFWHGDDPEPGDELETPTGRRYRIESVRRRRRDGQIGSLQCTVVGNVLSLHERPRRVFRWTWSSRRRRADPRPEVVVHTIAVPGSRLSFTVREEPSFGDSIDYVVTFASRRLQWCASLERAARAVRLWDRILRRPR